MVCAAVISHWLCLVIQPLFCCGYEQWCSQDGWRSCVEVWRCCALLQRMWRNWENCYKFWPSFWPSGSTFVLCAVHCHCLVSSPDPPHAHILCLCAFFLSIVNVFIVFTLQCTIEQVFFPRHPHNTRLTVGEIFRRWNFFTCALYLSWSSYKQLLLVCLLSLSFPTPDAVAPSGLQNGMTQTPTTDIMSPSSPRDSINQPLIPKDEDESKEENCCCVVF